MTTTVARLIGLEGELVREMLVEGCPPYLYLAMMRHVDWRQVDEQPTTPVAIERITFVREFVVPGGDHSPNIATYRREPIAKATKEPRST